ncbi:MAG: translation initiation factor IF-2 [Patescibacteria group bacterium]|nr:translation initiation factor IF-2 [Patescibacteria group bacterium]
MNSLLLIYSMPDKKVKIPFQITVREFAQRLGLDTPEIIKKLMESGIMASINESIDYETAVILAEDLGFETKPDQALESSEVITLEKLQEILKHEQENKDLLSPRPPIVTILGHVDHGKTTLLDTLRKTHIAEKESGGITQHITAYQVRKKGRLITFIDTPGHEAFQSMRQRGAGLADIAILVVAADDGVKPQTKEVAEFLLENKIPHIVAINKIDKPEANVNKVNQELAEIGILLEGYGGEIPYNEISAKNNTGLDKLLDTILLIADIQDFKANKDRGAFGIVLEAHKDPKKGFVATILIKTGTLKVGQDVMVGDKYGRIRNIKDYAGHSIKSADPSMPVTITGLSEILNSNDVLQVMDRKIDRKNRKLIRDSIGSDSQRAGAISSKELIKNIDKALLKKYSVIIKTDVRGTLEAIKQILETVKSDEVSLDILYEGVGPITETDIQTAQTSKATIYGFNVNPTSVANSLAEKVNVSIKTYSVIYELIEDIQEQMSELLDPEIKRTDLGRLKVLAQFKNLKKGMVVGGNVAQGKMVKGQYLEIIRDKDIIGNGVLTQLQQNKQDVVEVKENMECGITFEGKNKIEVGDMLICYKEEKIKRKL